MRGRREEGRKYKRRGKRREGREEELGEGKKGEKVGGERRREEHPDFSKYMELPLPGPNHPLPKRTLTYITCHKKGSLSIVPPGLQSGPIVNKESQESRAPPTSSFVQGGAAIPNIDGH
jgi:hypothetical protein